ncbi:tRNA-methyltransferase-domain-containing protein [Xylariaceae sp. FL0255]|nr:tRNA-methyltransferase-domain-containing protein [Xylariaceae sp. FL0255]
MEIPETAGLESMAAEKSEIQARDDLDQDLLDTAGPSNGRERGMKRPAEDDLEDDTEPATDNQTAEEHTQPTLSKNQLKKLKRQKRYEDSKQDRRIKRKEKRHERQERKRTAINQEKAAAAAEGREPALDDFLKKKQHKFNTKVPISIILDCQFEKYMAETELVSLANQVTRCYSDNRGAQHPVSLFVSSYGGFLKHRNETTLANQHRSWKNIHFCETDFMDTAKEAKAVMEGPDGGEIIDLLQQQQQRTPSGSDSISLVTTPHPNPKKAKAAPVPEPEAEDVDKSIVYLTADSPYTLDRLEPNTCYVVGGIIDKNREKGLCYKIAREKNVRTAKLPIGEFMVLQSRHILATNHVVEIMLKWLKAGDWGTAFMNVIPTRKGGKLKDGEDNVPGTEGAEDEIPVPEEEAEVQEGEEIAQAATETPLETTEEPAEVEGDNADEGLEKNALDQRQWSAPPLDPEKIEEVEVPPEHTAS